MIHRWRKNATMSRCSTIPTVAIALSAATGAVSFMAWGRNIVLSGVLLLAMWIALIGAIRLIGRLEIAAAFGFFVTAAALGVGLLLSTERWAPDLTNRTLCKSALADLHSLIRSYSLRHNGRLPDSLEAAFREEGVHPHQFTCGSREFKPGRKVDLSEIEWGIARFTELHPYHYWGKDESMQSIPRRAILMEDAVNHGLGGAHILWSDGSVSWVSIYASSKVLEFRGGHD